MDVSQQQPPSGQGRRDRRHIAPTLPPLVTQLPPTPVAPQDTGRPRKSAKAKLAERIRAAERRRDGEEPRFNVAAPPQLRTPRRPNPNARLPRVPQTMPTPPRFPRDTIIPDEPPPSFQEALMESSPPPFAVASAPSPPSHESPRAPASEQVVSCSTPTSSQGSDEPAVNGSDSRRQSVDVSIHASNPSLTATREVRAPAERTEVVSVISNVDIVDDAPAGNWDGDRQAGMTLENRVKREIRRLYTTAKAPEPRSHSAVAHAAHDPRASAETACQNCDHCGHAKPLDLNQSPQQQSSEYSESDGSGSPPISPRSGIFGWKKKWLSTGSTHDARSIMSPKTPVLSPRSPLRDPTAPWSSHGVGATAAPTHQVTPPKQQLGPPTQKLKRKESFAMKRLFTMSKGKNKEHSRDSSPASDVGGAGEEQEMEDLDVWQVVVHKSQSARSANRASMNLDVLTERVEQDAFVRDKQKSPLSRKEGLVVDTSIAPPRVAAIPSNLTPSASVSLHHSSQPFCAPALVSHEGQHAFDCPHCRALMFPPLAAAANTPHPAIIGQAIAAGLTLNPVAASNASTYNALRQQTRPAFVGASANAGECRPEHFEPYTPSMSMSASASMRPMVAGHAIAPFQSVPSLSMTRDQGYDDVLVRPRVPSAGADAIPGAKPRRSTPSLSPLHKFSNASSTTLSSFASSDPGIPMRTPRSYLSLLPNTQPGMHHAVSIGDGVDLRPRTPQMLKIPPPSNLQPGSAESSPTSLSSGQATAPTSDDDVFGPVLLAAGESKPLPSGAPASTFPPEKRSYAATVAGSPPGTPVSLPETPPRTPTTPTHHYLGRPLPQPPAQPSPHKTPKALHNMLPAEVLEHVHFADLDFLSSRVVDGYREGGHPYEREISLNSEAGHPVILNPSFDDVAGQRWSTIGRVQLHRRPPLDSRVQVKLILNGREVDKCCLCMSQFKQEELATLGTACDHAFHEYCLRRWLLSHTTCPLCRKPV